MLPTAAPAGSSDRPCHLQSLPRRALVIAPVRLALAGVGLVAALAAGATRAGGLLAFAATTTGTLVLVIADPRTRFQSIPDDPPPAPQGAAEDGLGRLAVSAVFPSTAGVAALLVVALAFEPTLAAVMAGILAGLGLAAVAGAVELVALERRSGLQLFLERGTGRVYARARGGA